MRTSLKEKLEEAISSFIQAPLTLSKAIWGFPFLLLSAVYRTISSFIPLLYKLNILSAKKASQIVISVGNLTIGGSGKTPFTLCLGKALMNYVSIPVVSRGYRARIESKKQVIKVRDSKGIHCFVEDCGDEPYLLANHLTSATVWAGPDRWQGIQKAIESGSKVVILDDALQNFSVKKDYDIALINAPDLLKEVFYIPFGPFRENFLALKRCHLVVLNQVFEKQDIATYEKVLRKHYQGPVCFVCMSIDDEFKGRDSLFNVEFLKKKRNLALAGIANPSAFKKQLLQKEINLVDFISCYDHQIFHSELINSINEQVDKQNIDYIICTEKDWVKLKRFSFSVPLVYAPLSLNFIQGKQNFDGFVDEVVRSSNLK